MEIARIKRLKNLPKALKSAQNFRTDFCSTHAIFAREPNSSFSRWERTKTRITSKFVKPSLSLSNNRSHKVLIFFCFSFAILHAYQTTHEINGKKIHKTIVKIGAIIEPLINKMIIMSTCGKISKTNVSKTHQIKSVDRLSVFCFSPFWIFRWYSIGRDWYFLIPRIKKYFQSSFATLSKVTQYIYRKKMAPRETMIQDTMIPANIPIDQESWNAWIIYL